MCKELTAYNNNIFYFICHMLGGGVKNDVKRLFISFSFFGKVAFFLNALFYLATLKERKARLFSCQLLRQNIN